MPKDKKLNFYAGRRCSGKATHLDAIIAAMTDPVTRPNVSISDAFRVALRIAAASLAVAPALGC